MMPHHDWPELPPNRLQVGSRCEVSFGSRWYPGVVLDDDWDERLPWRVLLDEPFGGDRVVLKAASSACIRAERKGRGSVMETFVHEFKSPINCYRALAVRHGLNTYPVLIFDGRQCYVTGSQRVWGGKGRNYHNSLSVHFLDGSVQSIPAGRFNKSVRDMTRTPSFDPRPLVTAGPWPWDVPQAPAYTSNNTSQPMNTVELIKNHPTLASWALLITLKVDASMWDATAQALVDLKMPILAETLRARAVELRQIIEAAERS